jgi:hypothetical protein
MRLLDCLEAEMSWIDARHDLPRLYQLGRPAQNLS